ncbi:DUF4007 family protein [Bacillus sp. E214]|uniref:DUF4007 family protein n=1 Tax=Bacillus sp. E214 TaxID=2587156 RepID=UPI0011E04DB0|nr:DUF4007 family protein [Bacillus sp. E214]
MSNHEVDVFHLNFHQTFAPETESIIRILSLASSSKDFLTKEEISEVTSIPTGKSSGKVEPHIYYAAAMKLITYEKVSGKYKVELTAVGKTILCEDPYLVENITKLLLHVFLVDRYSPAVLWSYLYNDFFPKVMGNFNNDQIQMSVERKFESSVNLTPFRTCYTSDLSFGSLNLIKIDDKIYTLTSHRLRKEFLYVYSYLLFYKWEELLGDRTEITIDEIIDTLYFGRAFLWGEKQIRDVLDLMGDEGLVKLNAQLSPITIIKNQSAEHCLKNIYSLLI